MTGDLNMNSQIITHHGIGARPTDLFNRSYIDIVLASKSNVGDTILLDGG